MAAQAAEFDAPFNSILIVELASYADVMMGITIARWTALPPPKCVIPQDAILNLVTAHIALARLQCDLPQSSEEHDAEAATAMKACVSILYWLNRCDLTIDSRRNKCVNPLAILARHEAGASVNCLREIRHANLGEGLSDLPGQERVNLSIGDAFPIEVAEMCRKCLTFPELQRGYFDYFELRMVIEFAIDELGTCGNITDIIFLRDLTRSSKFGRSAIRAIQELEQRAIGRHYVANTTAVDTRPIFDNVHVMFLSGAAPWRSIFSFRRRRGR